MDIQNFPEEQLVSVGGEITPRKYSCSECRNGAGLPFEFTMAFQPIVDLENRMVYSHEALVRGLNQEGAGFILSKINHQNRYQFDQACRVKAIELASRLNISTYLNINFLPNAVYRPETCIKTTLEASREFQFPLNKIIFEITEGEPIQDHGHILSIFKEYKSIGFLTAIDDFGAGYSGLNLLVKFQPDLIKLDMELIRDVDKKRVSRVIVEAIVKVAKELNIQIIAEGIETLDEKKCLTDLGVRLFQGYFFAKPAWESLAEVNWE